MEVNVIRPLGYVMVTVMMKCNYFSENALSYRSPAEPDSRHGQEWTFWFFC